MQDNDVDSNKSYKIFKNQTKWLSKPLQLSKWLSNSQKFD